VEFTYKGSLFKVYAACRIKYIIKSQISVGISDGARAGTGSNSERLIVIWLIPHDGDLSWRTSTLPYTLPPFPSFPFPQAKMSRAS
jgi:hypothetical protein